MNPILIDIPMPIVTKRLLIRPPMPSDGPELNAAVCESFENLHPWMPWATEKPALAESEANVRQAYANWIIRSDLRLSLFDVTTMQFVGGSGLHRIHWDARRMEIGYWIRDCYRGKGLMTEAVTAITQFAFQQLKARRVEIRCDAENLASKKIPERLSFKLEARLHGDDVKVHSDILRDTLVFARFDDRDLPDVGARWNTSELIRVNHVQITVPKNAEDEAKSFYCGFLGLIEIPKPDNLKGRGGFWMQLSDTQVHVGAEDGVERQATKAHIAYEVADLNCWSRKLRDRGIEILDGIPVPGIDRFEFRDPFGNRVEFLQRRKASEHDSL